MVKILILSLSTGSGHVQAAEALADFAKRHYPNHAVKAIDIAPFIGWSGRFFHQKLYRFLSRYAKWAWGAVYYLTNWPPLARALNAFNSLQLITAKPLGALLETELPDIIVCTYVGCAQLISAYYKKQSNKPPLYVVVTDHHAHHLFVMPGITGFFVPTAKEKTELTRAGVPADHVIVSGIPIHETYYASPPRVTTPSTASPTILLLSGGQGVVNLVTIAKTLLRSGAPLTIIAIAGTNRQLEHRLRRLSPPPQSTVRVEGWTDTMLNFLQEADIVITKPGGITISECIALKKPLLLLDSVTGQETYNTRFVLSNNYGTTVKLSNVLALISEITEGKKPFTVANQPAALPAKIIFDTVLK